MEQRRLRLGDILDDYCPRERRVTNHAIVAMIEEDVKQTRCTTCDAEHAYKGARVPTRRKKETPNALYKEVLAGMPEVEGAEAPVLAAAVTAAAIPAFTLPADVIPPGNVVPPVDVIPAQLSVEDLQPPMHSDDNEHDSQMPDEPQAAAQSQDEQGGTAAREDAGAAIVDGPVHRPLIRATLPRPEGQKDTRPVPEFTVRHSPARGNGQGKAHSNFRGERMRVRSGSGNGSGSANGNRTQNSGSRFPGNRPSGSGRPSSGRSGAPSGFRSGNNASNSKRGRGSRG
jgi:hypothetical protein